MVNPVLSFINQSNARNAATTPVASVSSNPNADLYQSYADLSTRDITTNYQTDRPVYRLGTDSDESKVIQPAVMMDGKHAVLVVREAPDTSSQLTNDSIKQARDMVPRSPIGRIKFITDDFILENISETEEERMVSSYNMRGAVISSTAENGKKPRIFAYSGKLPINNIDGSSFAHMVDSWDKYLRVTACVIDINGTYKSMATPLVVEMHYRDQVRRGYLMSVQYSVNAFFESYVTFSFSMFVTELYSKKPAQKKSLDPPPKTGGATAPFPYRVRMRNGIIEEYNPETGRWDPAEPETGGTTAPFPYTTRTVNGITEKYNPKTGAWEPVTSQAGGTTAPFPYKTRTRNGVSERYDGKTGEWVPTSTGGTTAPPNYSQRVSPTNPNEIQRYNGTTGTWEPIAEL